MSARDRARSSPRSRRPAQPGLPAGSRVRGVGMIRWLRVMPLALAARAAPGSAARGAMARASRSRACSTTAAATGTRIRRACRICSRDSRAHVAPGRDDRGARHADGRPALGLSVPARHGPRQHQVQRRRGRAAARVSRARRLPPRRRQLRDRRELPPRDQARLSGPAARRRAAVASDLSHRVRFPEGNPEDPRARRATRRAASASSSASGWRCTTAARATSETDGRTWGRTTIRRSCTRRRCAWA